MEESGRFDPKRFKGGKAGVIGLGRSGQACARLLGRKGFKVFGTDTRPRGELQKALGRLASAIAWEGGGHSQRILSSAFAVKSPGLPPGLPILGELRAKNVPVFSELEVALSFSKAKTVAAVSGTNGKTTTTALTGEILRSARRGGKVLVCGNIGVPISQAAPAAGKRDTLVIEVSSYQLEDSLWFRPGAAALLNITPDHLDHHGGMGRYIEAKARLFRDQMEDDSCVFNAADPIAFKLSRRCRARRLFFGPKGPHVHAWIEKGRIRVRLPGAKEAALVAPGLPGRHNLENAMAACLLALTLGVKPKEIQKGLASFRGVEHRLEEVGAFRGLRCINDSKATNVDSTLVALKAMEGRPKTVFLILGGLHKGLPYTPLRPWVEKNVKGILTIGSAARKVEEDLGGSAAIFPCEDLETAVRTAFQIGSPGEVLLLSPACASFDQFKDFEDRGRRFKSLLRSLS